MEVSNEREKRWDVVCTQLLTELAAGVSAVVDATPQPVMPHQVEVDDLAALSAALGLPPPPSGTRTMEVEILPGRFATLVESDGSERSFVYICTADLTAARKHLEERSMTAQWGPDTVDPETLRLRGCVLHVGGLVVDAVHCPRAENLGVPCGADCSPSLSFE